MKRMRTSWRRWLVGGLLLTTVSGCVIVSDLFNSDLIPFPQPAQGVIIVAFNNTTNVNATFFAFLSVDAANPQQESRNFSMDVLAGEVGNEVIACPIEVLSPGTLGADFAREPTGAIVQGTAGEVAVTYNGPVLEFPSFQCGDVVEIRLSRTGGGDEAAYLISVRVIPG